MIQPAVGWLLGPELIANLRSIVRRKGHRGDPRTWMAPNRNKAHDEYTEQRDGRLRPLTGDIVERDLWFDYIADLGDSTNGTYAAAFACQVDLQLDLAQGRSLPTVRGEDLALPCTLHVRGERETDARTDTDPETETTTGTVRGRLPRGEFLFVGGDTAYHVADEVTVRDRVARPFNWATQDLTERRWASDGNRPLLARGKTRIYGIPGNHDWYNDLHGFSLLFLGPREPEPADQAPPRGGKETRSEPIALDGFAPQQQASYVAIQLPYGWQLWGLDIDQGIDTRQTAYFRSLLPGAEGDPRRDPAKLILCTPSPPVVFHTAKPVREHAAAVRDLSLTPAYARQPAGDGSPKDCSLPPGTCRLDLSGDTHHYARYRWPEHGADGTMAPYMAVVSGLGGAFHHPSFTHAGRLPPVVQYPSREQSLEAVGPKLLNWRSLVSGSWIRAFPIVFGLILAFGSINHEGGSAWVLSRVLSAIPGLHVEPCGNAEMLRGSLLMLLTMVVSGLLFTAAVWLFGRAYEHRLALAKDGQPPRRTYREKISAWARTTYLWCTTAAIAGLTALLSFHLCPQTPSATVSLLDMSVTIVLLLGTIGGFLLAWSHADGHLPRRRKLLLGALGVVHGVAQIGTPWIFARVVQFNIIMIPIVWAPFVVWWFTVRDPARPRPTAGALIGIAGLMLALVCHRVLAPSSSTTPIVAGVVITATWLLQLPSRKLFQQSMTRMALMKVVWIVAWFGGIAALLWAAHGTAPFEDSEPHYVAALHNLVQFIAGSIMAAPLCLAYFAWYLAIAGLANAHNNEVGGAARVTQFRQIIRFHLHRGGLTGYAISVENTQGTESQPPACLQGRNLAFQLRDVFTIAPAEPPA
ncbi:MAG TPA: hypothetical protein VF516_24140 [Kofleriaceae bacterium]